jgi:hypothetical protein
MTETKQASVDFTDKCPTCQAQIIFDAENYQVFHALPMCDDFEKRDALEYVIFVREAMERAQKPAN